MKIISECSEINDECDGLLNFMNIRFSTDSSVMVFECMECKRWVTQELSKEYNLNPEWEEEAKHKWIENSSDALIQLWVEAHVNAITKRVL